MRNIEKAIAKAIELHSGQKRKGDQQTPYIVHPIETAMIVARETNYQPAIITAILHDTHEDCNYSLNEITKDFGQEVSSYIDLLSEDKEIADWHVRKNTNLERLRESLKSGKLPYFIRVADTLSNMRSLISTLREHGSNVWNTFNAPKNSKIDYYRRIVHDTMDFLPIELAAEYLRLLKDLERSEY